MNTQSIIHSIASSKKYKPLYLPTIERVVAECIKKYGEEHTEEKARNILHQMWAAYYPTRPDFKKLMKKFEEKEITKDDLKQLLALQTSTKERIPILDTFYQEIFSITGIPTSIIDYACGLNPLTLPWRELPENTTYSAFDIDRDEVMFLNQITKRLALPLTISVKPGDVLIDSLSYADVAFFLKTLPCLEHQEKHAGMEVLKKQPAKFLVVSFPIKSLGGHEKGMKDFYTEKFLEEIRGEKWEYKKILFETELVFVVKK